ncbi:MAG: cation-translocating P-type ATPase [Bacteroidetes bacterium]|nr:cation-translocating P-type ATPase [Bacteroidota bacterium]
MQDKIDSLSIANLQGLSAEVAQQKLQTDGYNELAGSKPKSFLRTVIDLMKEPMVILLVICGLLYLLLGSLTEGIVLMGGVLIVIGITLYQERKTEKTLDKLKDLANPKAIVIRDGEQQKIASKEVVVDDLIIIKEGDRIPADAVLVESLNLVADESILTGESIPVRKRVATSQSLSVAPGGDDLPFIFSGCLAVQGKGIARVTATGINTQLGKIGKSLEQVVEEKTPLQFEMRRIVRLFAIAGLGLCILLSVFYFLTRGGVIKAFLAGLSLAMAMLPEEFPVVYTIFMALGAWRMAKYNVLTRKPSAIETLGSATVLCSDKTGTITQNKMKVEYLYANNLFQKIDNHADVTEGFSEVIQYASLASQQNPFDPMERAINTLSDSLNGQDLASDWQFIKEYPLTSELLVITRVYYSNKDNKYFIAAKGAPEAIFSLCKLSSEEISTHSDAIQNIAKKGLRVIGVAKSVCNTLPDLHDDYLFDFCGLIGLADPIRPEVPSAVKECYSAGVRIIMITGDYPVTAQNIAQQIGLQNTGNIITGDELSTFSDATLQEKIKTINIFARIRPEQKLRIAEALKANNEIVAMTGDGVNDAPALKAAHIGIAMGEKGTDVAREAASIVLLDDNFSSIVAAIRMGRRIFDNLQKAFSYITAIHIPIAGLALFPVFTGLPIILWPIHIAFHELVIDPVSSIVFENQTEEKNIMGRVPRGKGKFFNRSRMIYSVTQGAGALAIVILSYLLMLRTHLPEAEIRTFSFITLIIVNISMIFTDLATSQSSIKTILKSTTATKVIIGIICVALTLILLFPGTRTIFQFELFPAKYSIVLFVVFVGTLALFEVLKRILLKTIPKAVNSTYDANHVNK